MKSAFIEGRNDFKPDNVTFGLKDSRRLFYLSFIDFGAGI